MINSQLLTDIGKELARLRTYRREGWKPLKREPKAISLSSKGYKEVFFFRYRTFVDMDKDGNPARAFNLPIKVDQAQQEDYKLVNEK